VLSIDVWLAAAWLAAFAKKTPQEKQRNENNGASRQVQLPLNLAFNDTYLVTMLNATTY
jgi:hypothetical protein